MPQLLIVAFFYTSIELCVINDSRLSKLEVTLPHMWCPNTSSSCSTCSFLHKRLLATARDFSSSLCFMCSLEGKKPPILRLASINSTAMAPWTKVLMIISFSSCPPVASLLSATLPPHGAHPSVPAHGKCPLPNAQHLSVQAQPAASTGFDSAPVNMDTSHLFFLQII